MRMWTGPDALVPSQIPPLPDQVKGLAPIVNLLLRRDRFVVTVMALKPVRKEVALHVRLSRSTGRVLESRRFTEAFSETKDRVEAYSGAAMMAGCWLAFMLEKYARSRFATSSRLEMLGTGSWLSYAWLCRGLRDPQPIGNGKTWVKAIEDSKAWFNAALRVDHRNIGALIALGQRKTIGFGVGQEEMDDGVRHLGLALDQLEQLEQQRLGMSRILRLQYSGTCANSQWYQVTYALAVAYTNYCAEFLDDNPSPGLVRLRNEPDHDAGTPPISPLSTTAVDRVCRRVCAGQSGQRMIIGACVEQRERCAGRSS